MGSIKILAFLSLLTGITIPVEGKQRDVIARTQPAYTIALLADRLNSSACTDELLHFKEAVDHRILWALRVLDSSGSPKPGFVNGNNYWLGSRSQCEETRYRHPLKLAHHYILNNTRYRNPKEESPPFDVRYFVAHAIQNSTLQYHIRVPYEDTVTLGLCLPASCSTGDISDILTRIFHNRTLLIGELYSADLKLVEVRDLRDDHRWLLNGKIIFFVILVLTLLVLMITATIYDMTIHQNRLKLKRECLMNENNNTGAEVKCNNASGDEAVAPPKLRTPTLPEELLMCFSMYTNTKKIFSTKLGKRSVPCIHGMKFIGMFWIILAHGIYFLTDFIENKPSVVRTQDKLLSLLLSNATYSVDTFLCLSGFLAAYVYWSETMSKDDPKKSPTCGRSLHNVALMLSKRYLRLSPTYMLFLGFHEMNSFWYSKTAVFSTHGQHEICANYWWRNMFYINNLFDWEAMCMQWSWYLAVDMQFYVLATIVLTLSTMYFYAAATVLGLLLVGSMITSGYASYALKFIFTLDEEHQHIRALYMSPWTRFGPYAVGVILAFVLVKFGSEIRLTKKTVFVGWCLSCFCNLAVMFGIQYDSVTVLSTAFYMALSRTAWGMGIAWVIFACCTKNAVAVNRLLCFKGFIPLSRLTYCAYLVNPLIIQSVYLNGEAAAHIDVLNIGLISFGLTLASYLSAYVLCLMIEMPSALLINVLTKPRRQRK